MSRTKGCFHQFPCEIIVFSFSNNWKLPCAFNSRHFPNANRWTCVIYLEHVKGTRDEVHFELGRRITKVVIHSHMNMDKRKNYRIKLGPPDLAVRDLIPRFLLGSSFLWRNLWKLSFPQSHRWDNVGLTWYLNPYKLFIMSALKSLLRFRRSNVLKLKYQI